MKLVIGNKNYSSWSLRAWLALKYAGIPFEEELFPLYEGGKPLPPPTPSGKVPCLIDGDVAIWDSLAIAEFAAERGPLWPKDATARALARAVSCEMHSSFMPLRTHMPMNMRAERPGKGREPGVEDDIKRIKQIWRTCLEQSDGPFLFGDFSIADCFYAPVVSRFRTYGVELDELERKYADALWAHPLMQEWAAAAKTEPYVIEKFD